MTGATAVVTAASAARLAHVRRQQAFLDELGTDPPPVRVIAWLDEDAPPAFAGARTLHVPPGRDGLRVAAARNAAAEAALDAGAELMVFLDADCLPGPGLLPAYAGAAEATGHGLLAGPVTYLAEAERPERVIELAALTRPHPARPAPGSDRLRAGTAAEYDLFWSLSFACTPSTWREVGGFSEAYEGYGAEDTDFAWRARDRAVPLVWVGGADAYHQWHPTSSPPWQHLDAILRNGATFAARWGVWPMRGWLDAFAAEGAIVWDGATWCRADLM